MPEMWSDVIHDLLAPTLMISACGLLCLAQFARYTAILTRLRTFSSERLGLITRIRDTADDHERRVLAARAQDLRQQSDRILDHACTIRSALMCLVGCILCMVACSLLIGLSLLVPVADAAALIVFVLGLLFVTVGMTLVLIELRVSICQARVEIENLARFERGLCPDSVQAVNE